MTSLVGANGSKGLTFRPICVLVLFMNVGSPANPSTELPEPEAMERRARHLRILTELADIGMELVQHVRLQVLEEVVPPGVDPVLAFATLAKAVRQTVALEAKVAADGFATSRPISRDAAKPAGAWRIWDGKMKARVRKKVEEAIASGAEDGETENLLRDLNERLDDPEYGDEMSDRPIGMVVAYICGALGVEVDLKHFSDAEMGFDTEVMKSATRVASDARTGAGSASRKAGAAPRTGLDPPFVSRDATGLLESRAETAMRSTGRPEPDD
jgi:hypothetical protein